MLDKNWKSTILIGMMLLVLLLIYVAERMPLPPWLIYILIMVGGTAVVAMGADDIRKRRSGFYDSETGESATYYGFSAVMWGVFFILLGLGTIATGLLLLLGAEDTAVAFLKARPGLALLLIGALLVTYGVPSIAGAIEEKQSLWRVLVSMPGRLFGGVLVLLGLLFLVVGGWEMIAPAAFDGLVQQIMSGVPAIPD